MRYEILRLIIIVDDIPNKFGQTDCMFTDYMYLFEADLNHPGDRSIVSRGGQGGGPHNNFKHTKGVAQSVRIDLKLLADVGLVG